MYFYKTQHLNESVTIGHRQLGEELINDIKICIMTKNKILHHYTLNISMFNMVQI